MWSACTLGQLCDSGTALIQTGPFGSQLHAHDYTPSGVPVIATEGIGRRRIVDEGLPRVPPAVVSRLSRHILREGDILFARRGVQATGLSALVDKKFVGSICGTGAILLRLFDDALDPTFLSFFLSDSNTITWLKSQAVGAVMPNLNETILRRLEVPLPPLPEQHAIAAVLGALDDKIDLNHRMNETLEETARALFKSWFVDFDPVRAKAEGRQPFGMDAATAALFPDAFEESHLGEVPRGWRSATLSEWAVALSGGTPSKTNPALWGGDIPWVSPKSMTEIHADQAEEFVTAAAIGNGTRLAPVGSTLVMVRGMGLHERVRVSQARRDVTFNQDVKALVPRGIEATLLLFALLHGQAELLKRVQSSGHGTGVLPSDILLAHVLTMPDAPTQRGLTVFFDNLNSRIESARVETRTLANLRDYLLPKLLSGEIRVTELAEAS